MRELPAEVTRFAHLAANYISWCQTSHDGKAPAAFQFEVQKKLAELYAAALTLPGVEAPDFPDLDDPDIEERKRVVRNLTALPFQYYWTVFSPTPIASEVTPLCGDLFDDLLDIYVDLSRGLKLFQAGHPEAAVFTWQFSFGTHWGHHLVDALQALHTWDGSEQDAI